MTPLPGGAETCHDRDVTDNEPEPPDQRYYWSDAWQADERIAQAELAAGDVVEFDTADDALRWLAAD